ncbi:MAG: sugar ABC transporter permease [Erysipelotrichaceae bacterium]|nr:sugar ABC transporter permease [Erysipelotrichaceae bacterium]
MAKEKKKKSISYAKWGYIFIIPFFVVYFIFTLYPQLLTFYNSFFENYREGLSQVGPNFVGFQNYVKLLTPSADGTIDVLKYFGNTLIMWVAGAIPQFVVALLLALLFTSTRLKLKGQTFAKTTIYMPNLIMASAFSMLFFSLFSTVGPINQILMGAGILETGYDFISHKVSARFLVALMNFIMWFGNTTIVLMAGIMGIDESLFESARIDGASSTHVFMDITLPLLRPILVYAAITSLIGGLQMFDVPQVLSKGIGMPNRTTFTVIMLLNNYLGGSKNYGMAGAISVVLFIITGILSIFVFKALNKKEA